MNTDAARALLREVARSHPMCCSACLVCLNCGHSCQQVRLAHQLRRALRANEASQ